MTLSEMVTEQARLNAWYDAPTRPPSESYPRDIRNIRPIWVENGVTDNVPWQKEHRLEVVGCSYCGWERLVWPEESAGHSEEHQTKHRFAAERELRSAGLVLPGMSDERVLRVVDVVLEAVREKIE